MLSLNVTELKYEDLSGLKSWMIGLYLDFISYLLLLSVIHVMLMLLCGVIGKKGGALATAIHSYLQHGDPTVRSLIRHMLALVSVCFSHVE